MIHNKASRATDIQVEIDRVGSGVLLVVKLLNKHELNVLLDDITAIISQFTKIVEDTTSDFEGCAVIESNDASKLYIIAEKDFQHLGKLASLIYSRLQLHINEEFPEVYLRSSIDSIGFSPPNNNWQKLESSLVQGRFSNKEMGYYYAYEDNPLDINDLRKRNIELNLLRSCLNNGKAVFMYQPIIDRKTDKTEYYECLLRIPDENGELISVGPMIKDAEEKGLISIIDFTVIEMVVNELINDEDISLSVNISNIGVLNKKLLVKIQNLFQKHNVAKRLIIEITETSFNRDFDTTKHFIDTLRNYGCRFALDDFGAGFTSFEQLFNLPIDIIKIDGTYICNILSNEHSRLFVKAVIDIASDMGKKTVAEFVENKEVAQFLVEIKVGAMQGNYFLPASKERCFRS